MNATLRCQHTRAGPLADRVACTRTLLPAGVSLCVPASASASLSLCLSATRQRHAAMQARGSLVCGQAARTLTMAAREQHGGGAGAARRLRGNAGAVRRRRGSSTAAARSELGLQSACGAADGAWCSYALPYFASREALRPQLRDVTAVHTSSRWLWPLPLAVCSCVYVAFGCLRWCDVWEADVESEFREIAA